MDAPQDMEEVYRLLCSAQALAAHDEDALRRLRHEIMERSLEVAREMSFHRCVIDEVK